jgi:NAD-dependent dihydropyrimidine dehydrogenase PreA subunit
MPARINEKCTNCGVCVSVCPTASIYPGPAKHVIDYDTCDECLLCVPACPYEAIEPPKK